MNWERREFLNGLASSTILSVRTRTSTQPHSARAFHRILLPDAAPPAARLAAEMLASELAVSPRELRPCAADAVPAAGELLLALSSLSPRQRNWWGTDPQSQTEDGYQIGFRHGGALVLAQRPRGWLYAAGACRRWCEQRTGEFSEQPAFALRSAGFSLHAAGVARVVAELGVNLIIGGGAAVSLRSAFPALYARLSRSEQSHIEKMQALWRVRNQELARQCQAADVPYYPFLYGNNFALWSPALYRAAVAQYPEIRGLSMPHSWEKATLCPSQPRTWEMMNAYVREFIEQSGGAGLYTTFWDHYGIYCHNQACRRNGLNQFHNELYLNVQNYHQTLHAMGKRLVVRTWSSGCPHWLGRQYVHAPGYGHFGGTGRALWGRVIDELPADILLQTKVYNSDCEPNPPFSPLIGEAGPHPQVAEYQIVGQTTGRFYLPASCVAYNTRTLRAARRRLPASGGISVSAGGTLQRDYSLFDDLCNSINLYAWRRIGWDPETDLDQVWREWALPRFGPQAAPHVIRALQLSETAVVDAFSPLGMGSDTNSNFAPDIARRETLLMYTNRFFLPRYTRYLQPVKRNIERVRAQKHRCLGSIEQMREALEQARPHLAPEQAGEFFTRLDWLWEVAICRCFLDESLWRFRYLRHLATLLTTDPEQMEHLSHAWDVVHQHAPRLFQYRPEQRFSCYRVALGRLPRRPSLGDPLPLMNELYFSSKALVERFLGPHRIPDAWLRGPDESISRVPGQELQHDNCPGEDVES